MAVETDAEYPVASTAVKRNVVTLAGFVARRGSPPRPVAGLEVALFYRS
ncbi:MAG: hypothetical protein P8Z74_16110 [Acidobacteriota bacterium]